MKGIAGVVVIGVIAWLVINWLRKRQAEAVERPPVGISEYERLHAIVPITRYVEKELKVFSIEEYNKAMGIE